MITPDYSRVCGNQDPELLRSVKSCFRMTVKAASKWNASCIRFAKGETYRFEVTGTSPVWFDGDDDPNTPEDERIHAGPEGWPEGTLNSLELISKLFVLASKPFRRSPDDEWFYLMGMTAEVGETQFPIGSKSVKKIEKTGEFCAFANDLPFKYGNNSGSLTIRVTPME